METRTTTCDRCGAEIEKIRIYKSVTCEHTINRTKTAWYQNKLQFCCKTCLMKWYDENKESHFVPKGHENPEMGPLHKQIPIEVPEFDIEKEYSEKGLIKRTPIIAIDDDEDIPDYEEDSLYVEREALEKEILEKLQRDRDPIGSVEYHNTGPVDPDDERREEERLNRIKERVCKICGEEICDNSFDIPICDNCANLITEQQVNFLIHG